RDGLEALRGAVKDRRRGLRRSDDGHGCSNWQGIAVAVRADRLIPERESAKGPAQMVADPPGVSGNGCQPEDLRVFPASKDRCRQWPASGRSRERNRKKRRVQWL